MKKSAKTAKVVQRKAKVRAMKLVLSSLVSHLPYFHVPFDRKCVSEYVELLALIDTL